MGGSEHGEVVRQIQGLLPVQVGQRPPCQRTGPSAEGGGNHSRLSASRYANRVLAASAVDTKATSLNFSKPNLAIGQQAAIEAAKNLIFSIFLTYFQTSRCQFWYQNI